MGRHSNLGEYERQQFGREERDRGARTRLSRAIENATFQPGPPVAGALDRCWCGEPIGHDWSGKERGVAHPKA